VLGDLRMPGLDLATAACSAAQSGVAGMPMAAALLLVSVEGMPPQELSVRVRPGAPASIILPSDHPWAEVMPSPCCSAPAEHVVMSCQAHCRPHAWSINKAWIHRTDEHQPCQYTPLHKPSYNCGHHSTAAGRCEKMWTVLCLLTGDHCQRGEPIRAADVLCSPARPVGQQDRPLRGPAVQPDDRMRWPGTGAQQRSLR